MWPRSWAGSLTRAGQLQCPGAVKLSENCHLHSIGWAAENFAAAAHTRGRDGMANDQSPGSAETRAPQGPTDTRPRVARQFRQIVLWPIQLIAGKERRGRRESADALFERLGGGNWELVD